jgi:hypothetical protein
MAERVAGVAESTNSRQRQQRRLTGQAVEQPQIIPTCTVKRRSGVSPFSYRGPIPYGALGSRSRFRASAFTATSTLEPDIEMAAISGRSVNPKGSKTPAAIGSASEL